MGKGKLMIKVVTGNEAAAYGALLAQPDVICTYPITPQSRIPEQLAEFHAEGKLKGQFVNAESEMGAINYLMAASAAGVRTFTATSSQGIAWMHEMLHWISGARLPVVMVDVNRPLAAPFNLTCEQTDSLAQRDTGWMQFYCESNQEVLDTVIQAFKLSETISLPCMVCLDGVYLSYISESIEIPDQGKVDNFLGQYRPAHKIPNRTYKLYEKYGPECGDYKVGGWDFMASLMRDRYELHKLYSKALPTFNKINEEFQATFGRSYPAVEEYKCDDADLVLVLSGSAVGTGRAVVNKLREAGQKVGLIKLKMFRPFPGDLIRKVAEGKQKLVVVERDISRGQGGIWWEEIRGALQSKPNKIYGFIAGLGGRDITPDLIEKAVAYAAKNEPRYEAMWLGLSKEEPTDDYDRNTVKLS